MIRPILILPKPGWILYDSRLNVSLNKPLRATHGYNAYECQEMMSIFFARGPAFKRNVTIEPFESVNIYPLLAHLLGINPRPNNGSLSVFKHVLKHWNDSGEIRLGANYRRYVYTLIVSLVVLPIFYFLLKHFLLGNTGTKTKVY